MGIGTSHLSNTSQLTQRLLWNRMLAGSSRPLPVVVLLGPVGAGKTWALKSISEDCGSSVVHSHPYDFGRTDVEVGAESATTISALAEIAGDLSRGWRARPRARFYRFTLGWIAAHQKLDEGPYERGKEDLRQSIEALTQKSDKRISAAVATLVETAVEARLLPGAAANVLEGVLPPLIQALGHRPLRQAKRWHSHRPAAQGAPPLDALYALNRLAARGETDAVTAWLVDAFLADVRQNHKRMARNDAKSSCRCEVPGKGLHWHNWVVLLDNVDRPAGARFIADLLAARERYEPSGPSQDRHDPLLIIATSGRWDKSWQPAWRPIWEGELATPDRSRTVRKSRDATYTDWFGSSSEGPKSVYYPVLLEPLTADQTAQLLGIDRYSPECELASRATGGLPGAVDQIGPLLRGREIEAGRRDVLAVSNPQDSDAYPWYERLGKLGLLDHVPDFSIDDFVAAAPFATAPWLIPHNASSFISQDQAGRILTELRTALWVSAPKDGAATTNYAELHPWLANTLNSALARPWPGLEHLSYDVQFKALLGDQDTSKEPMRKAYCQLALGDFSEVVDFLEATFDKAAHREWVGQLALITSAPDNLALDQTCGTLYAKLVDTDNDKRPRSRSPVRNPIVRIVAARWLQANHFTMPDPELRKTIAGGFASLRTLSRRPDVGDLWLDI